MEKISEYKGLIEEIKNSFWNLKPIGSIILNKTRGESNINKNTRHEGNFPALICKNIFDSFVFIDKLEIFVDQQKYKGKTLVEFGDILMATHGHTKNNPNGFCTFFNEFKALAGNNIYILKHNQNPKYLINYLHTKAIRTKIESSFKEYLYSTKFLSVNSVGKIEIPIPSLILQEKIGNFLFKFAEYEKKLQKELKSRRKQFQYYKELLFEQGLEKLGWEIKNLGEIATEMDVGKEISKDQLNTGDYPGIKNGDINSQLPIKFSNCISFVDFQLIKTPKYFEHGDILLSGLVTEECIGKTCVYLGNKKCLLGERVIKIKHDQNSKYLSYAMNTNLFKSKIKKCSNSGIIINIHKSTIRDIKIPLPDLKEQERIVNILDKLYDICENPDKGIQLLIKHNRQQYEYYRELIFDEIFKTIENR